MMCGRGHAGEARESALRRQLEDVKHANSRALEECEVHRKEAANARARADSLEKAVRDLETQLAAALRDAAEAHAREKDLDESIHRLEPQLISGRSVLEKSMALSEATVQRLDAGLQESLV